MSKLINSLRSLKHGAVKHFLYKKTKRKITRIADAVKDIKLEIGAGGKKGKNGWLTMDLTELCDLPWDLRNGIPFPDASLSVIYSSHFFEHLSFQETKKLITECRRVLKEGGIFSICVPNARPYLEAYTRGDKAFLEKQPSYYQPAYNNTTIIDLVNYVAYMDGQHKYMFDENNLLHILSSNGLKEVKIREFDAEVDMPERRHESIYAQGIK
jgi:predicted SAM-dependent methyltransferase